MARSRSNDIKLNGFFGGAFMGDMASFSSRGPVKGLGQVKPDISAPGVQVLAACPPASLLGALAAAANPLSRTTSDRWHVDGYAAYCGRSRFDQASASGLVARRCSHRAHQYRDEHAQSDAAAAKPMDRTLPTRSSRKAVG